MKLVIDVEANSLHNPTKIWCIVTKDLDTGVVDVYRNLTEDMEELSRFKSVWASSPVWIGHNVLGWDFNHLRRLLDVDCSDIADHTIDTLIISKLADYSKEGGHSIENYGLEFGFEKLEFSDFSKLSEEMVTYCLRDVEISEKIFHKYRKTVSDHKQAILTEHQFQWLAVNAMHDNGFAFDVDKANKLLDKVNKELKELDEQISKFPDRVICIREVHPILTSFGTLHRKDFRFEKDGDLSKYNGGPFCRIAYEPFNASSLKQVVNVLWSAGWKPEERTKTAILVGRSKDPIPNEKIAYFKKYGWKVNEHNLNTLPNTAPKAARTLARRILVEARRRTLTEWIKLISDDKRIHAQFIGIGAWTHRMAHQKPNMANIPNHLDTQGRVKYLGAEMRSLFIAPKKRLLVGVDAAAIQLRIFAHYINDAAFTKALVEGKKENKSDPHSLNQSIIGKVCKSRAAAKRYIFALLLGAGVGKLAEILECTYEQANASLQNIMERYRGFADLKTNRIPADAKRGWFFGIDGRKIGIPGINYRDRIHLAMSGYLQSGEVIVMKMATLLWMKYLEEEKLDWLLVNLVHDEWQTECSNFMDEALIIAKAQDKALHQVGIMLQLNCPLAGSYYDDDRQDYTIGTNWKQTH